MHPQVMYTPDGVPDFDLIESAMRKDIATHERLALAIYRALPAFVSESAVQRMTIDSIAELLSEFHGALRDFMCAGLEDRLGMVQQQRNLPMSVFRAPKPTPEDLYNAQKTVERLEESLGGVEQMETTERYGMGAAAAMMRPMIEQQLDYARHSLERIQAAIDAPDEAGQSSMSNEAQPGETSGS